MISKFFNFSFVQNLSDWDQICINIPILLPKIFSIFSEYISIYFNIFENDTIYMYIYIDKHVNKYTYILNFYFFFEKCNSFF